MAIGGKQVRRIVQFICLFVGDDISTISLCSSIRVFTDAEAALTDYKHTVYHPDFAQQYAAAVANNVADIVWAIVDQQDRLRPHIDTARSGVGVIGITYPATIDFVRRVNAAAAISSRRARPILFTSKPLSLYGKCMASEDWLKAGELMLSSARRLIHANSLMDLNKKPLVLAIPANTNHIQSRCWRSRPIRITFKVCSMCFNVVLSRMEVMLFW